MNIIGAQYAAKFGFPSKIVFTKGNPNANVLCDAQYIAATTSSLVRFNIFREKNFNRMNKDEIWIVGNSSNNAIPCLTSIPNPL